MKKRKRLVLYLCAVMILFLLCAVPFSADGSYVTLDIAQGDITLSDSGYTQGGVTTPYSGDYLLTGSGTGRVTVTGGTHTVILRDLNMTQANTYGIKLCNDSRVTLTVSSTNTITRGGGNGSAVIGTGGSGDSSHATITVNGGIINCGWCQGAAECMLGAKDITIRGGIVNAVGMGYSGKGGSANLSVTDCIAENRVYGAATLKYDYTIPSGTEWTVPQDCTLTAAPGTVTYENDLTITADDVRLTQNTVIGISLDSDFTMDVTKASTSNPYQLPYQVFVGEQEITAEHVVAMFDTQVGQQSATLHITANNPVYAGTYSDTVTFNIQNIY